MLLWIFWHGYFRVYVCLKKQIERNKNLHVEKWRKSKNHRNKKNRRRLFWWVKQISEMIIKITLYFIASCFNMNCASVLNDTNTLSVGHMSVCEVYVGDVANNNHSTFAFFLQYSLSFFMLFVSFVRCSHRKFSSRCCCFLLDFTSSQTKTLIILN